VPTNPDKSSVLKILYISHLHPPKNAPLKNMGGMQRVSLQLVDTLSGRNDVEIKTIGQETSWDYIELKTTRFLFNLYVNLPVMVDRYKPDVILFSSMVTASLAPFLRNRIDVPMVTINHGHDVTLSVGIYQWLVKHTFKALDGVISVSSATRMACIQRGLSPEKGIALPNGFQMNGNNLAMSKSDCIKTISKVAGKDLSGKNILLTTGRMVLRKGHEWFINEVLPLINHDTEYVIIGDGPEMKSIVQAVINSSKRDNIHILGRQKDDILHAAYIAADLFVMPNIRVAGDMEGFGIVMLEANIAGTPVIASDLEGIKDVVKDGVNGYKIEVNDSAAFAMKIDEVLHNEIHELSQKAREFVIDTFTWEQVAEQYLLYLTDVQLRYRANMA
jgi:phosphatidylinositol alpha-1,6-mannosyltransferase